MVDKRTTHDIGSLAGTVPQIAGFLLAGTPTVCLADDTATGACGEDMVAIGAGLEALDDLHQRLQ